MNELIKVTQNEKGEQLVSGRELHEFLGVKTRYNDWFLRMCEYGFVENTDYITITQKKVTAQGNETSYTDHAISLSMAKELSMIQRNKKGKEARLYFIECEKQLKNNTPTITEEQKLVLSIYAGGVEAVEATKALVQLKTKELQKTIEYKEDVIVGLTDEIDLKDKRQILNQVVRYKGANYQERWRLLYYEFEKKYHLDLNARMKRYNEENKPKMKNKLDYIDKVMNKLPQLYEIASKLFEGDINKIIEEYKQLR